MKLNKTKIVFSKGERSDGIPESFALEDHSASHWMIEELMLLSNEVVATYLNNSPLRDVAVLRNHLPPDQKKYVKLQERLDVLGTPLDYESASSLYASLLKV